MIARVQNAPTLPPWIVAERQAAGRGRRGRVWQGASGNLAATLLLTTDKPPAEAAQVAFVTALALADMAAAFVAPAFVRVTGLARPAGPHRGQGVRARVV